MAIVIDGYNLLHASGILGRGIGPGGLERSRQALLNFLAETLDPRACATTTVVFDGREAPPGLARKFEFRGLTVLFAPRDSDADQTIEELIRADSSPRKLTVVSSDHRLHRAARRRKARPVDSDRWYTATLRERLARVRPLGAARQTSGTLSEAEVQYWLRQFGIEGLASAADATPTQPAVEPSDPLAGDSTDGLASSEDRPDDRSAGPRPLNNPFPPGYAEDISEQDV